MKIRLFRSILTVLALILTVACVLSFTSCDFEFKVFKDPDSTTHQTDKPSTPENTESNKQTQEPSNTDLEPTPDTDKTTETDPKPTPDTDKTTETDPVPTPDTGKTTETDPVPTPDTDKTTETDPEPTPDTDKTTETDPVPTPDTDKTTETDPKPTPDTDKTTETESISTPDTTPTTEPDDPTPEHKHSYTAKTTAPTCTAQGYTTYTCTCGDSYKADYKNKLGHDLKTYSLAPTCTQSGYDRIECSRCDYTETKTYPATGHSFTKVVTSPTCTEQGFTTYTCACGHSEVGDYVKATGHIFGEWKTVTQATTTSEGTERRDCINCDEHEERTVPRIEVIPTDFVPYEGNALWGYTYLNKQNNAENLKAFYRDLDNVCKSFYTNYTNVTDAKYVIGTVSFADRSLSADEALMVHRVFTLDTPRYYWLAKQYYHNSQAISLCIDKDYATGSVRKQIAADISSFIAELKALTNNYSTISEKALAVHDYIIKRIDYKYEADGVTPLNTVWAHNILGVVQGLGGVCETYAETYQLVLSSIGIDCITVHGDAPTAHAWSSVKFEDGKWYNIDVTWDDLSNGNVTYIYFGQAHSEFVKTHKAYTSSSNTSAYMFDYPTPQDEVDLSPVTLYKNGTLVGRFVSFHIIKRIDYKYEADGVTPLNTVWAHNILGVVQGLGGVCETYAETYQLVLSSIGIDCITVHGDAPTAHAWSSVKFEDGKWYNIDVTWDDLSNGNVTYIYFGQAHSEFVKTHKAYTSSSNTSAYMFDYPTPQDEVDLSPVTLYKNGTLVGRFVSFRTAFLAMTDTKADYTVEMDDCHGAYKLYDDIPAAGSVKFKGTIALSGQSYYITTLQLQKNITASTNVLLEDIALEGITSSECILNILGNTLTLTGTRVNLNNGFAVQGDKSSKLVISTTDQSQLASDASVGSIAVAQNAACLIINGSYDIDTLTVGGAAIVLIYDMHPITFNADQIVYESGNGQIQLKGRADTTFTVGSIKGTAQYAFLILMAESLTDIPKMSFTQDADIPLYFAFWPESNSFDIRSYDGVLFTAPSLSPSNVYFFLYEGGTMVNKRDLFKLENGECKVIKN